MRYYLEIFGRVLIVSLLITLIGEMLIEESIIFYFVVLGILIIWAGLSVDFKEKLRNTKNKRGKNK